jgi:serine phosphatase RsbU (regulator of sigma subunit)
MNFRLFTILLSIIASAILSLNSFANNYVDIAETQQKINSYIHLSEVNEGKNDFYNAYLNLVESAKLAHASNLHEYATELYIRALSLRLQHEETFPTNFPNKNIPFLKLCRLLQQAITDESIFWHKQAIWHCEMDADTSCTIDAYSSLALYYTNMGLDEKSIQVIEKVIPIAEKYHDKLKYSKMLLDYSDLLNKLGKYQKSEEIADKGYKLILDIEKTLPINEYRWSYFFIELKAYIKHNQKQYAEAEKLYLATLDSVNNIRKKVGNLHDDVEYISNIRLGKMYFETGRINEAKKLFERAKELREKPENKGFNAKLLYETMIMAFSNTGDYQKAFEASEKYREFIYNSYISATNQQNQSQRDLALLNIQNAQNELDLLREQADTEKKNNQVILLSFGLLGFVIVALTLVLIIRQKQKNNQSLQNKNNLILTQKNEITSSIEYAEKIQNAILPSLDLFQEYLKNSFVFYLPRDIVSGDFYWLNPSNNEILVACADCTGHGVPGAIVSMLGYNGLNSSVNEKKLKEPKDILNNLNDYIENTFSKSKENIYDGMDIALVAFNPNTFECKYSGANIPLYIVRNQEIIVLKPSKQPVGKFDHHQPFTQQSVILQKNDMVYMFSDGLQDQFGDANNKKFKVSGIKSLLLKMAPLNEKEQLEMLSYSFFDWKGNQDQVDDLCFIGFRV